MMEYLCVAIALTACLIAFMLLLGGLELLAILSPGFRRFLRWLWRALDM